MARIGNLILVALLIIPVAIAHGRQEPIRIAIAGLTHGHVEGFLYEVIHGAKFALVGISEVEPQSIERYFNKFGLDRSILFRSHSELVEHTAPHVVAAFGPTTDHLSLARLTTGRRIPLMVEKPLAVNFANAVEIERLSQESATPVITNYETTWYPNTHFLFSDRARELIGKPKKVVVRSGHQGPLEIGVYPEFLSWLTDPLRGGGALLDFGCYGAQLIALLYGEELPIAVTAITQSLKSQPAYAGVEDEATVIVEYPSGLGIIQASWNWPSNLKEWEVHGERGSLHSLRKNALRVTESNGHTWETQAPVLSGANTHPLELIRYYFGQLPSPDQTTRNLGSVGLNSKVSLILEAAARSAREGRRITF